MQTPASQPPARAIVAQGDVLLIPVDRVPAGAVPRPRDEGRVILAYGEVTGHAHQIGEPDACGAALLDLPAGEAIAEGFNPFAATSGTSGTTYLLLEADGVLRHEEHDAHSLAAGAYEVRTQAEYTPEEIRDVAD